ncbi:hypothetical protein DAT35_05535 [Vitiosangium sp. GDMCC 1.1324]|nr:hypothetical protein DAT35_05535 [Vitiosangium sp. GDMCC 1.1324]
MPWLHTVTSAEKASPGFTPKGPDTFETMKSGRLPTPMSPPLRTLLLSTSSCKSLSGSTRAMRNHAPSSI